MTPTDSAYAASKSVKITYQANGGKFVAKKQATKKSYSVNKSIAKKIGKLPSIKRTGYTLKGWYTKKSGGKKITKNTKIKKNAKYFAQWKRISYSVKAKNGTYIGYASKENGVAEFLGIPYAAPIEYWKAPKPPKTTSKDKIKCNKWGPSCLQRWDEVEIASLNTQAVDCLQLNIWTKDVKKKGKPVLVFIHGGSNWRGGTYDPMYHGQRIPGNLPKGEDVCSVTINFRLGINGVLDLSSLDGYTDEYKDSLALAVLDQERALEWIQENIAAFGGDPKNVTVYGQSGGAGSISSIIARPNPERLMKNAIIESGSVLNRSSTVKKAGENAQKIFNILEVDSVDGLIKKMEQLDKIGKTNGLTRNGPRKDLYDVMDAVHKAVGRPQRCEDGNVIPFDAYLAIKNGSAKNINVMIGVLSGENDGYALDEYTWDPKTGKGSFTVLKDPADLNWGSNHNMYQGANTYWDLMNEAPALSQQYLKIGEGEPGYDIMKRAADMYNDGNYYMPSTFMAEAMINGGTNVYFYYWEWAPDINAVINYAKEDAEFSPWGRPLHCTELIAVLDTVDGYHELAGPQSAWPRSLIKKTQATWYAFAKTGNPTNKTVGVEWKKYTLKDRETMNIDPKGNWKLVNDPRKADRLLSSNLRPKCER